MNKIIIPITLCLFSLFNVKSQQLDWAHSVGWNNTHGTEVISDSYGNTYVTGSFEGSFNLDPNLVFPTIWSGNVEDTFVGKYDSLGNLIWQKHFGGNGYIEETDIAIDNFGNLYITGQFSGLTDFDPSLAAFELQGDYGDCFVSKLDSNGNFIWAIEFGGPYVDRVKAIEFDKYSGTHFYVTGFFQDTADFDPSTSSFQLISTGDKDLFLAKYTTNGNLTWAHSTGNPQENDQGEDIAIDANSNVILVGVTGWDTDVDFSLDSSILSSPMWYSKQFVAKYDSSSNLIWARGMPYDNGSGNSYGIRVEIDSSKNIFLAGNFGGYFDFNHELDSSLSYFPSTLGMYGIDFYIVKYSEQGDYNWHFTAGGYNAEEIYDLELDNNFNPIVIGIYTNQMDLGTNGCSVEIGESVFDVFMASYEGLDGSYLWHGEYNETFPGNVFGISVDSRNNVIATGEGGVNDADFSNGENLLENKFWIASYNLTPLLSSHIATSYQNQCEGSCVDFFDCSKGNVISWQWNFNGGLPANSTSTNPGTVCFQNAGIFEIELIVSDGITSDTTVESIEIFPTYNLYDTIQTCYGNNLNNLDGTTTGNIIDTLTHINYLTSVNQSCDSIVNITYIPIIPDSIHQVIDTNYLCYGDLFILGNGNTFVISDTINITDTLQTSNIGCDSIVHRLLIPTQINTGIIDWVNAFEATGNIDSIQWINCDLGTIITGETSPFFAPIQNGNYAYISYVNQCADTSICLSVPYSGINNYQTINKYNIYPNPASREIKINSKFLVKIYLLQNDGKLLYKESTESNTHEINVESYATGIYFLLIKNEKESWVEPIIIKHG